MEEPKYDLGQLVDLVIEGKRNRCEVVGITASAKNGIMYDLLFSTAPFNDTDENYGIMERVKEVNILHAENDFKNRPLRDAYKNPFKDPANHPLWVLLNEIKRGRPAADQLYLQPLIDQLKVLDEAQA